MKRIRIIIEIETEMTREQINRAIGNTAPVFIESYGKLVYLAIDHQEPPTIIHNSKS